MKTGISSWSSDEMPVVNQDKLQSSVKELIAMLDAVVVHEVPEVLGIAAAIAIAAEEHWVTCA